MWSDVASDVEISSPPQRFPPKEQVGVTCNVHVLIYHELPWSVFMTKASSVLFVQVQESALEGLQDGPVEQLNAGEFHNEDEIKTIKIGDTSASRKTSRQASSHQDSGRPKQEPPSETKKYLLELQASSLLWPFSCCSGASDMMSLCDGFLLWFAEGSQTKKPGLQEEVC